MTLLKTIFVFIYLKILELGKGIVWSVKYVGKNLIWNILIPLCITLLGVIAFGGISLGIWYFFHQPSALGYILHYSEDGYIQGIFQACFCIGGIEVVAFVVGWSLCYMIWSNWHYVPELIVDNWIRAKRIVVGR